MTTPAPIRVGFVGLGVMGKAMARNILRAGFPLMVHNRSRAKVEELVAEGGQAGASPADVAGKNDIVLLSLPDTPDVEAVLFSSAGVIEGAHDGLVVIDTSTISATATVEFAARLAARGVAMIDSPVSGGPKGAAEGTLSCILGGNEAVVARCMPVLQAIGKTFVHVGPSGAGQAVKACNQLVIVATLMGVSEAIALCRSMNIDPILQIRDDSPECPRSKWILLPMHPEGSSVTCVARDEAALEGVCSRSFWASCAHFA